MQLVVIILNEPDRLNEMLELILETGAPGGTVLDSEGIGKLISSDVPLFARFGHVMQGVKSYNKTIISLVEDDMAEKLLDAVATTMPDSDSTTGLAFSVPVGRSVQLRKL